MTFKIAVFQVFSLILQYDFQIGQSISRKNEQNKVVRAQHTEV